MTTWARNVNNQAVDITTVNPATLFHPDVAAQFVVVPDGTETGATYAAGAGTNPGPVTPITPPVVYPMVTGGAFYLLFKIAERIAIKASTDPVVEEFWATYQNAVATAEPIDLNSIEIHNGLIYLSANPSASPTLAPGRIAQILSATQQ